MIADDRWPVEHDGLEYQPIPESWIKHPSAYDSEARAGPRLYAVSAAVLSGGRALRIRYSHARTPQVLITETPASETDTGPVPTALAERTGWPRSLLPGRSDPNDVRRACETDWLRDLWGDRVAPVPGDDERLIADGGHCTDGTERVGWFDALGHEVPRDQRDAAAEEARKMGVDIPEDSRQSPWVNEVARLVERARPKEAIKTTRVHLDLTGTYRFLAALCVPLEDRSLQPDTERSGGSTDGEC